MEFFLTLWLVLPFTDGAALAYTHVTAPYVAPVAQKIKDRVEGWVALLLTLVNLSHLFFVWFLFASFSEDQRRFAVVAVGTVYPLAASTIALATAGDGAEDTF